MKKIIKNLTIISIFTVLVWLIFSNSKTINQNVLFSFDLWVRKVFPSLFPMFIISNILVNYGLATYIGKLFKNISSKLFKVSGVSGYVLVMALLSGTPSNAVLVRELYDKSYINHKEASKILAFTFFASPLFLYNFLNIILNDNSLVIKIILICYISNIIIGLLFRSLDKEYCSNIEFNEIQEEDFTTVLTGAIKRSMNTMIMILGTITFFIIISSLINLGLHLNQMNISVLKGILELTQGLDGLIVLDVPVKLKAVLATAFISFGGLSIHMQIKSIINDTNISYKLFFGARILHVLISLVLLLVWY